MAIRDTEQTLENTLAVYRPRIAGFIARMNPGGDPDDLIQETLVRVARGWGAFRGESTLSSWIFRIAANVAIDDIRSRKARPRAGDKNIPATEQGNIQKALEREEQNACVGEELAWLPEQTRRLLIMRYMDGASIRQIAKAEGATEGAVKTRLNRARESFRKALLEACHISTGAGGCVSCEPRAGRRPKTR